MKIDACIQQAWKIPKEADRVFSVEKIKKKLFFLNRTCNGNFYVVDYYRQRLIMGDSSTLSLYGHSKDLIEKEGFGFYDKILKKPELDWLEHLTAEAHKVLYHFPVSDRLDMEFSYELFAQTIHQQEVVLQHKIIPYELCRNGNLWLGLCFVSASSFPQMPCKATIINHRTGAKYNFVSGLFVLSGDNVLTPDEIVILESMAKDIPTKQICGMLKISDSSLARKKRAIFYKLGVNTAAGAVYKARTMRVI